MELHFGELPSEELETILHQRCSLPPSYCTKLVKVMQNLQVRASDRSFFLFFIFLFGYTFLSLMVRSPPPVFKEDFTPRVIQTDLICAHPCRKLI